MEFCLSGQIVVPAPYKDARVRKEVLDCRVVSPTGRWLP